MPSSLFDAVVPREDVLEGTLAESIFAASLEEVVNGKAPAVYSDPAVFFAGTHPSAGLRALLDESLGRIGGGRPDAASVIRLETNLGGGKTHNLIALYHAARGHLPADRIDEFMAPANYLSEPIEKPAVFVGTSAGATSFPEVDGVEAQTLWGLLALQLGGKDTYSYVREADDSLTAPGSSAIKDVLGGEPRLILIDELARYLSTASGKPVGSTTLARQTVSFLMALMEAVDAHPRASLVITTTETTEAFGDSTQEALDAIAEARQLMARREHVLRPSEEADLPKILARRLFESVDRSAATELGQAYAQAALDAEARGVDVPETMEDPRWAGEVAESYPFHPTLIRVLDKRLSTIPNFQRTRGALRLLARTVRSVWENKQDGVDLIRLDHVDLGDNDTVEDLSSRLDRGNFEPVIRADIVSSGGGEPSHAEVIDEQMGARHARRLATAAYLFSLTTEVPSTTAGELIGSVLGPNDDPSVAQKALDGLESSAWYLHVDARGYRFSTERSLNKMIEEATREITTQKTKVRATEILSEQFRDGALKVRRAWEDAKVPDRSDEAQLVILHWDDFPETNGVDTSDGIPPRALDLWERTPAGGIREFRNRLVMLAPTGDGHTPMLDAVRRQLALTALADNSDALASLAPEKRAQLNDMAKESELEARVAVCNHVNLLFVPHADGLEPVELDSVTRASVKRNQTEAILDRLAAMEKTLATGDKALDPGFIKQKLGAQLESAFPTSGFAEVFARRTDLKLVLDKDKLRELVASGVRNGVWDYHDAATDRWATKERPDVSVRLGDDTFVYPSGSAPPPVDEACPICGMVHGPGPCPGTEPGPGGPGTGGPGTGGPGVADATRTFTGEGNAATAFATARQAALDAGRKTIERLDIRIGHVGAGGPVELQKLLSVVPTSDTGVTLRYDIRLEAGLGQGERLVVEFGGQPADYAHLRDGVRQAIGSREAVVDATLGSVFDPAPSLDGEGADRIQSRAADTGPSKCTVTITTEAPDGAA